MNLTSDDFHSLADRCRELHAADLLMPGIEYFVNSDSKIDVRAIAPKGDLDVDAFVRQANDGFIAVRHAISTEIVDVSSDDWNRSEIGRLINFLADQYRKETYIDSGIHNVAKLRILSKACVSIAKLCLSSSFARANRAERFRLLNECAAKTSCSVRRQNTLVAMSMIAELVITIDDMLAAGTNDKIREFANSVLPNARKCIEWFDGFGEHVGKEKKEVTP